MGSELPENGLRNGEHEPTLIFGSGEEQSRPGQGNLEPEDLAFPVESGSSSRPALQTQADLPVELAGLKHELEVATAQLRQEHAQRLKAEAHLSAILQERVGDTTTTRAIQEGLRLQTRQMELIQRMESLLEKADMQGGRPASANGWAFQLRTLLPSLAAGILGGGLAVAVLPWRNGQRQVALSPSSGRLHESQQAASPARAPETIHLSCAEPCWLDIRTADSGKQVFYKLLKGTANFAVGTGLDVFSGRADLVKVRINEGEEQPFLPGQVVGSRVIRPSTAPESSP